MEKPQILILHGWGLSGKVFAPLVSELKRLGYRALAPDLPGFGSEPPPSYPWRLRDYVRFVDGYLRRHHISKPIFIGHSFGGRISLKYQELYPKNIAALILSGTPGFTPVPKKKLFLFIALSKVGKFIFSIPPLNLFQDYVRRWYYYAVGAKDFFRAEGVMRDIFKLIVQEELVTSMQAVSVPCLLLWGEYDIITPASIAHRMKEVMPNVELKIIPESDHGVSYKHSEVFARYIDQFLKHHLT